MRKKNKTLTDVVLGLPNPNLSEYSQFKSGSIAGEYGSKEARITVLRESTFHHYKPETIRRKWGSGLEKSPSLAQLLTKLYCVLETIDQIDPTMKEKLLHTWNPFLDL